MLTSNLIFIRLLISVLLGSAIGLERERSNQPAGFRTHIILCVGSTLMMMISIFMSEAFLTNDFSPDPTRIAAQVVSGIGFLGAGAIMRIGVSIKGLTTAASLWTTGGIGLGIGCGFYFGSIVSAVIILISLTLLSNIERIFVQGKLNKSLNITVKDVKGIIGKIEDILLNNNVSIKNIQISRSAVKNVIEISAVINIPANINLTAFINKLTHLKEVFEVEVM